MFKQNLFFVGIKDNSFFKQRHCHQLFSSSSFCNYLDTPISYLTFLSLFLLKLHDNTKLQHVQRIITTYVMPTSIRIFNQKPSKNMKKTMVMLIAREKMYLRFVILQKFDSMFTFQMSNMILPDSRTFRSLYFVSYEYAWKMGRI